MNTAYQSADQTATLIFLAYFVVGLPVAWLHARQQKMLDSVKKLPNSQSKTLVVFTLATLWPLLLLAMALNRPYKKKRDANTKQEPKS